MSEVDLRTAETPEVLFAPAPDWVELPPFTPSGRPLDGQGDAGRCFWLSEVQINLQGPRRVWLNRLVSEVTGSDGLQDAGMLDLDFNPAFETLTIHHIRVIRDGQTRQIDPRLSLQVFRRERDLERAKYDGRLTAHMIIPDVRVGDIVDICHSTTGAHPSLRDRFAMECQLNWSVWVGETRIRLIAPADRKLAFKTWNDPPEPQLIPRAGGSLERRWVTRGTAPVPAEADTPPWTRRFAIVQAADVLTWAEVADAFRDAYSTDLPLPEDLEARVEAIAAASADPAVRAVQALRLVQADLRYQAVNVGDGGYVPQPVDRIWASRSGDCKDASRLLTALLRRLGIEADPALVNTLTGPVLDHSHPFMSAFDHCIVGLRVGGVRYWVDPTQFPQGGRLEVLHQARFGWALPLVADAALEDMGQSPYGPTFQVAERIELPPQPSLPGTLRITTTYRTWRADGMRRRIESGVASLTRDYIDYYTRLYGTTTELEPIKIADDLDENVIVVTEAYEVAKLWDRAADDNEAVFETADDLFRPHLTTLRSAGRRWPIDLGLPREVASETLIKVPGGATIKAWARIFDAPGVKVLSKCVLEDEGKAVRISRRVEVRQAILPPEAAESYFEMRENALRSAGIALVRPVKNGKFVPPRESGAWSDMASILGWVLRGLIVLSAFGGLHYCSSPPT